MTRLAWLLQRAARKLGAAGLLGLALLLGTGLAVPLLVRPLQSEVQHASRLLSTLQHRPLSPPIDPQQTGPQTWALTLPAASTIPAVMGQLSALAHAQGLAIEQGQYSVTVVAGTPLLRWHARLPLTGTYPAVRAFLAKSLQTIPALQLDGFKLERQDITAQPLQAELLLSVYLRGGA